MPRRLYSLRLRNHGLIMSSLSLLFPMAKRDNTGSIAADTRHQRSMPSSCPKQPSPSLRGPITIRQNASRLAIKPSYLLLHPVPRRLRYFDDTAPSSCSRVIISNVHLEVELHKLRSTMLSGKSWRVSGPLSPTCEMSSRCTVIMLHSVARPFSLQMYTHQIDLSP